MKQTGGQIKLGYVNKRNEFASGNEQRCNLAKVVRHKCSNTDFNVYT
jgi:hypothetical protein